MDATGGKPCPDVELIQALAEGALDDARRRKAEALLERNEACREHYRQLTRGRYPELPNYTIVAQVGKGGFGVVYKAVHHTKERIEALKVLFSRVPLLTSYFQNEVHLIARLRHPNIATLFEAQLASPPLYYTMEFVEGQRLSDALRQRELSLAERIEIIRKTALALGYAHREGVVHRDVKPQNILIDADGEPHVVDFGIAQRLGLDEAQPIGGGGLVLRSPAGPVGTLGFIAPEQARGAPIDGRADIYSLGAMLFQCVTGEPARLVRDKARCEHLLRERSIGQPQDLAAVIARCVEENPEQRYANCEELAADLESYLRGREVRAGRDRSWTTRAQRITALMIRDHPFTLRAAVIVLAAVLMAGALWRANVQTFSPTGAGSRTVLVRFGESTLEAIRERRIGADLPGLNEFDRKSWRMLHGQLMEKLAPYRPLVVVWDYFFPDERDEFDDHFARGAGALEAPVVVGAFFDVNGQPRLSPTIREAVHGAGSLAGRDPGEFSRQFEIPVAVRRGFESPIPGLAVAAFAAARFPECAVDVVLHDRHAELRYRKRRPKPNEPRWLESTDIVPVAETRRVRSDVDLFGWQLPLLQSADQVHVMAVSADPRYWQAIDIVNYEDLFTGDERSLRSRLSGRAVVIGQMIPPQDRYLTRNGEEIYGCQVHAAALDQLLVTGLPQTFAWKDLVWRTLIWSFGAGLAVSLLRPPRRVGLGVQAALCTLVLVVSVGTALYISVRVRDVLFVHVGVAAATFLATFAVTYLLKAIRTQQLRLAPQAIRYSAADPRDAPSTILAQTR